MKSEACLVVGVDQAGVEDVLDVGRAQIEVRRRELDEVGRVGLVVVDRLVHAPQEFLVLLGIGLEVVAARRDDVDDDAGIVLRRDQDARLPIAAGSSPPAT